MTKRKAATFAIALLASTAVFGLSFFGARMGVAGSRVEQAKATGDEIGTRSIAIPGFEAIQLKAGQQEQSVSFYNPAGNSCYFQLALILEGEELFTSDMIAPGEELHDICITQPLAAGVYYDARIRYRSFDLDSMEELNGAEVVTILDVET